ncbi:hypothetical protein BU24DRAFT_419473 [Aaosphaeria arxii CBS 175.79]|uniref:F-box domain-containing protein n=1 Tax=Aaosphaeria arxii CBS 175.79 TaxID=1450172 RepID=A0A6A5Y352_9PLEO|nr:uncharacterized protein BU24DRAFT_419473 [Aaosphaeria arxii CBS 175.79]KAF2019868.1 hypothetical protein BU24DRAFT_419473 [Aaosphaeria arxii CBS 175.79]
MGKLKSVAARDRRLMRRAARRRLAQITQSQCLSQRECPLFTKLPNELRNMIYEYVLAQHDDPSRPIPWTRHRWRFAHEHRTFADISLLATCRRIYMEAHPISIRGATYHIALNSIGGSSYGWDHPLFHISSQLGKHLYHLHAFLTDMEDPLAMEKLLLPHAHWRRITWSGIHYGNPLTYLDAARKQIIALRLPSSCEEVNLEVPTIHYLLAPTEDAPFVHAQQYQLMDTYLTRTDGKTLSVDRSSLRLYNCQQSRLNGHLYNLVLRVTWRTASHQREYLHCDRLDCLRASLSNDEFQHEVSTFVASFDRKLSQ